jgi:hypothetical protein
MIEIMHINVSLSQTARTPAFLRYQRPVPCGESITFVGVLLLLLEQACSLTRPKAHGKEERRFCLLF